MSFRIIFNTLCVMGATLAIASMPNISEAASVLVSGAKITMIEGTPMPVSFGFKIDKAAGACPAGAWLTWHAQGDDVTTRNANAAAIYSTILTAFAAGKNLEIGMDDSDCTVHIVQVW